MVKGVPTIYKSFHFRYIYLVKVGQTVLPDEPGSTPEDSVEPDPQPDGRYSEAVYSQFDNNGDGSKSIGGKLPDDGFYYNAED